VIFEKENSETTYLFRQLRCIFR